MDVLADHGAVTDPLRSPVIRARVVAGLFAVVPLVCLVALQLGVQPVDMPAQDHWTYLLNAACLVAAPLTWHFGPHWPVAAFEVIAAVTIGALAVLLGVYGDTAGSYLIATLVELLLVVCFAFLPTRAAVGQLLVAAGSVLWALRTAAPGWSVTFGRWLVVMCAFGGSGLIVGALRRRLGVVIDQLNRLARTDSLTGLANRRAILAHIDAHLAAAAPDRPVAVVIADIDHFKLVNDTYGHPRGDQVLAAVAVVLVGAVRPHDVVGRLGGEEFAVLLPSGDEQLAMGIVERLAARLRELPGGPGELTMSFGVAVARAPQATADLLQRADTALYQAKRDGRDRVVLAR